MVRVAPEAVEAEVFQLPVERLVADERERAHGREGFAGLQLAGQDGLDGGEADLVEDGLARRELDLEGNHAASGVTWIL